jgi:Transposase DDE domain group 1
LKVIGSATFRTVDVVADGTGLCSRAGSALLALAAQRLGLTDALSGALAGTRKRRSSHDPGRVLCDLAVMAADGGRCVSDLAVLAGQGALFGDVASVPTARHLLDDEDPWTTRLIFVTNSDLDPAATAYIVATRDDATPLTVWDRDHLSALARRTARPGLLAGEYTLAPRSEIAHDEFWHPARDHNAVGSGALPDDAMVVVEHLRVVHDG